MTTLALNSTAAAQAGQGLPRGADNFYHSDLVTIEKVAFKNQYSMQVVGNLVSPKRPDRTRRAPAIVIGHPMGAVKEQSAMLYAQKLAEQGFVTLAIDLPFWGESEGQPRNLVAPKLYSEAFSAHAPGRSAFYAFVLSMIALFSLLTRHVVIRQERLVESEGRASVRWMYGRGLVSLVLAALAGWGASAAFRLMRA